MRAEAQRHAAAPADEGRTGSWTGALRRGVIDGSTASLVSALALAVGGHACGCGPYAPLNAPSQWLWGKSALAARAPSLRYTLTGCMIHHASSVLWATVHARWLAPQHRPSALGAMAGASATAALACAVDYTLTPARFRPGFEQHLSRPALAGVYAALALGLAASALSSRTRRR